MNQLILGDNLEIMRKMDSESVDLIYLDPPFFSNRNYEVIWGDKGEVRSFEDRWSGGVDHYIAWLKERVQEMHRLLKPTGSIYLHCDWHADAYVRVLILDKIFKFRNDIVWKRSNAHNDAKGQLGNIKDTIFFYTKSDNYFFNKLYTAHSEKYISAEWNLLPSGRYYKTENLLDPRNQMEEYDFYGTVARWRMKREKLEALYNSEQTEVANSRGRIKINKEGKPLKRGKIVFLDELQGVLLQDIWDDIPYLAGGSKERIGYPTQKPEKLLERIILTSSNEGDTVLDPFVGGGTTVVVAEKLKRNWIGIDQSVQAVKVTEMRIEKAIYGDRNNLSLFANPYSVRLHKYDYDTLRYKEAFEFEKWIVEQFGGIANMKQRGDFGIDGRTREGIPIQVKRSDNIGRNVIDNFFSALQRYDKTLFEKNKSEGLPVGYIIAFSFGKGAVQEVARLKNEEEIEIKLVQVEDIVPIAKKPTISVRIEDVTANAKPSEGLEIPLDPPLAKGEGEAGGFESELQSNVHQESSIGSKKAQLREIEFIAVGESEAGIEFYAFDFDYNEDEKHFNASDMLNKDGKAQMKFKPGKYTIAVKVVDNEGLEAIEVIKIKVNGVVEVF